MLLRATKARELLVTIVIWSSTRSIDDVLDKRVLIKVVAEGLLINTIVRTALPTSHPLWIEDLRDIATSVLFALLVALLY